MNNLPNQLLNKEKISTLLLQDWEVVESSRSKETFLLNSMEIKVRGIKDPVTIDLYFKEPIPNGLALSHWTLKYASSKIGEGRRNSIQNTFSSILNDDKYLLSNWLTENKYVSAVHLKTDYGENKSHVFMIEKSVEPELLLDVFADRAHSSYYMPKTRLVFHNNKIYQTIVDHNTTISSEQELEEYIQKNNYEDKDMIIDSEGVIYTYYLTPEDANNIRVLNKDIERNLPISNYVTDTFTYREYAMYKSIKLENKLPIIYENNNSTEKYVYNEGQRTTTPYEESTKLTIYSERILGEGAPDYLLGDYIEYVTDNNIKQNGHIVDISKKETGFYGIQVEKLWVYSRGEKSETNLIHVSAMKKIAQPAQQHIGEIIFEYKANRYQSDFGFMGEIVYEFNNYYLIKMPAFIKELKQSIRNGYGSYHIRYVNNGDGYIYATVLKKNCLFLRKQYCYYYKLFRDQEYQFQWIKEHEVLGTFLYPLLKVFEPVVTHPRGLDASYQFEAIILFFKYHSLEKTEKEIYADIMQMLEKKRFDSIRNITLRGMYELEEILETYFSETYTSEVDELLELIG